MPIDPTPFGPQASIAGSRPRRQRLGAALGQPTPTGLTGTLSDLGGGPPSLPQQPGDITGELSLEEPDVPDISRSPEVGQPSLLATERVERAPGIFDTRPLLGPSERAGAALGEAERGEVSERSPFATGGLSSTQRRGLTADFFGPAGPVKAPEGLSTETRGIIQGSRIAPKVAREGGRGLRDLMGTSAASTAPWAAENAIRAGKGVAPFTHTFTDPRFPGMDFPISGAPEGIPSTPIPQGAPPAAPQSGVLSPGTAGLANLGLATGGALLNTFAPESDVTGVYNTMAAPASSGLNVLGGGVAAGLTLPAAFLGPGISQGIFDMITGGRNLPPEAAAAMLMGLTEGGTGTNVVAGREEQGIDPMGALNEVAKLLPRVQDPRLQQQLKQVFEQQMNELVQSRGATGFEEVFGGIDPARSVESLPDYLQPQAQRPTGVRLTGQQRPGLNDLWSM